MNHLSGYLKETHGKDFGEKNKADSAVDEGKKMEMTILKEMG